MKISEIEKQFGLPEGSFKTAIETNADIEMPKLHIRTEDEETQLQANIESQKKARYEAGIETGTKREVNDFATKLGYNLDGKAKTVENLLNFHTEAIEKKIKKPVTELETDFKKLQENYLTLEKNHNDYKLQVETEKNTNQFRTSLAKGIPANVELMFNPERIVGFAEKEVSYKIENGQMLIVRNGEVEKDKKNITADYARNFHE